MAEITTHSQESLSGKDTTGKSIFIYAVSIVAAIGGLLFGFGTGVIAGAIPFVTKHFNLNSVQEGFAVGVVSMACVFGASAAGLLSDRFGRKKILIASALIFTLSSILAAIPKTYTDLIIARFLCGLAVGVASVLSPVYIAEIAPAKIRGRLISINQFTIVFGMLLTYFINWLIVDIGPNNWRWMFFTQTPPAAIFFIALFFVPESPRWLMSRGNRDAALAILTKVDGRNHAEAELGEIERTLHHEKVPLTEIFKPGLRKVLFLGVMLAFFATASGSGPLAYYAPTIFLDAGYESASAAFLASLLVVLTILIFTIVVMSIVDKVGRKPLLLIGETGMTLSLIFAGIAYMRHGSGGSWILIPIVSFFAFYAVSIADIVWVMLAEMFPNRVRGIGMGIGTMVVWLFDFLAAQTFPWLTEKVGGATFYIYAGICATAIVFIWMMIPETKGKSLEEIERMWEHQ